MTIHSGLKVRTLLVAMVLVTTTGACSQADQAAPTSVPDTAMPTAAPTSTPTATAGVSLHPAPAAIWDVPGDAALPDATTAALQAALDTWVARGEVPGVAAAIVSAQGSWADAAGVDAASTPIEPTSAFGIGSVTKTFTAAELLLLGSQGAIDLDAPVTEYVSLPFETNGATIRQLATMKSGFPAWTTDATLNAAIAGDLDRTWSAGDVLTFEKDAPRAGSVGGVGVYNGLNYEALSLVIEQAMERPLATVLRSDLLESAGLDRIWLQVAERPQPPLAVTLDPPGAAIVDRASGFLPSRAAASTGAGAAGMAADAPSLARWGYLLFGGRIIDPDLVAVMTDGDPASEYGYGFGAMVDTSGGELVVGHGGDFMGYSVMLLVWTRTQTSVAVVAPAEGLTNSGVIPGWAFDLYQALPG